MCILIRMTPLSTTRKLLVQYLALHSCRVFRVCMWSFVWVIVWLGWASHPRIIRLWCWYWRIFLIWWLLLLERLSHLREMDRQENWSFATVVWAQYLRLFTRYNRSLHACCTLVILVGITTKIKLVRIVLWSTFEVSQKLIVSLGSHDNLAMNVLNVHIFSAVPCMSSHQGCLISHAIYIVNYSSMSCLLKRRCCIACPIISSRLLDRVQRATRIR